jgi:hypothetical protein
MQRCVAEFLLLGGDFYHSSASQVIGASRLANLVGRGFVAQVKPVGFYAVTGKGKEFLCLK